MAQGAAAARRQGAVSACTSGSGIAPMLMGGMYIASPSAVTDLDVTWMLTDEYGHLKAADSAVPVVTSASGASAIATSYAPAAAFWLESTTLHLSAAGSTAEDFTITLDATDGAAYDTVLLTQDLSTASTTDLLWQPDGGPLLCEAGDIVAVAWANSDVRTYGLRIVAKLA